MADETPRIIVDDDWKAEAQREKEEADRQTRDIPRAGEIPGASLPELIEMIALQATVGLGAVRDPQTNQPIPPNLPLAKHYIDMLEVLQDKTQGNLEDEEQKFLGQVLSDLRMAFVQISSALHQSQAQESPEK